MKRELKILILEDNTAVAELVVLRLRLDGFIVEPHIIETPDALTLALDRHAWDIIVSDYSMPAFTGIDALRTLRARDPKTPFILMTANPSSELKAAVRDGGGQDFLDKLDLDQLPERITRLLAEPIEPTTTPCYTPAS